MSKPELNYYYQFNLLNLLVYSKFISAKNFKKSEFFGNKVSNPTQGSTIFLLNSFDLILVN